MQLVGYSKALYSTWLYAAELRVLLDAGEGVNLLLGPRLAGVRHVCLGHGHTDHFTGLMNVVVTRMRLTAGEQSVRPLEVWYPAGDRAIEGHVAYLERYFARFARNGPVVRWHPLKEGDRIRVHERRRLYMVPFRTRHTRDVVSLGYSFVEERDKLLPEFAGLTPAEIAAIVRERGKGAVTRKTEHTLLSFSGDTVPMRELPCAGTDLLLHEATFLTRDDADTPKHSVMDEVLDLAAELRPGALLLYHFSSRYRPGEIDRAIRKRAAERGLGFPVGAVHPGVLFDADFPPSP